MIITSLHKGIVQVFRTIFHVYMYKNETVWTLFILEGKFLQI